MKKSLFLFVFIYSLLAGVSCRAKSDNYKNLVSKGDSCMSIYDYLHALNYYQQAQLLHNGKDIKIKIGDCYFNRSQYKLCTEILKAVGEDSLTHAAYRNIYYAYKSIGNVHAQDYWGGQLIYRYPLDSRVLADLINLKAGNEINNLTGAISYGEEYFVKDSNNIDINRALANAYFENKEWERSISIYKRLLVAQDTTFYGLYRMGVAYQYSNQPDTAIIYLQHALSKQPQNPMCLYSLGITYADLHDTENAIYYLNMAINKYKPNPNTMHVLYRTLGQAYLEAGKEKDALDNWNKAQSFSIEEELNEKINKLLDREKELHTE